MYVVVAQNIKKFTKTPLPLFQVLQFIVLVLVYVTKLKNKIISCLWWFLEQCPLCECGKQPRIPKTKRKRKITMFNVIGFSLLTMDSVAYRGLFYTFFILNFVLVCQLILLHPLASGTPWSVSMVQISFEIFCCTFWFDVFFVFP